MKHLKMAILDSKSKKVESLCKTLNWAAALWHKTLVCSLKFNCLSIVTPKRVTQGSDMID
jgi:hypothetical protein